MARRKLLVGCSLTSVIVAIILVAFLSGYYLFFFVLTPILWVLLYTVRQRQSKRGNKNLTRDNVRRCNFL
jgi:hypothetical protein